MLQYLEHRGTPASVAMRECGIELTLPGGPDDRVPGSQVERLWTFAIQRTEDPIVGLHMAESYSPGALDILGYVVLSCRTIGDVLDRLSRYAPLLNDGMRIEVAQEGTHAYCRCTYVEGVANYLLRAPDQAIAATWAGLARELRRLTTKPLAPTEVWFRHKEPAPSIRKEYARVLGAPVSFNAIEDRFIVDAGILAEPVRSANPALLQVFEQHADAVLSRLAHATARSRQVAELLARNLKGSVPQLSEIARDLAMSDRNLQRALRNDGTTFQRLLDEVRRDLAISHLANPSTSAGQIGFLLGFSEPSAFHRAFRRWTGKAPGDYRQFMAGELGRM